MSEIVIKSPEGEEIELVSSDDEGIIEGAFLGASALLNLLSDEMDLEDGYEIVKKSPNKAQKWGDDRESHRY